jgi:biotin operon repressor
MARPRSSEPAEGSTAGRVLAVLREGPASSRALMDETGASRGAVGAALNRLEQRFGLPIERRQSRDGVRYALGRRRPARVRSGDILTVVEVIDARQLVLLLPGGDVALVQLLRSADSAETLGRVPRR